jgi:hypothetical protein
VKFLSFFSFVPALVLMFAGCAGFESRDAAHSHTASEFPAHWDGHWKSAKHHGMGGHLRCVLTKIDARHERAQFHAQWGIFSSGYTAVLNSRRVGKELRLNGTHRLTGMGGGLYHYEGRVSPTRFTATYDSSYDNGTFDMSPAAQ